MSMEAGQVWPPCQAQTPSWVFKEKATAPPGITRRRLPKHTLGCLWPFIHTTRSGLGSVLYGVFGRKARHASFNNAILPLGLRQSSAPAALGGKSAI